MANDDRSAGRDERTRRAERRFWRGDDAPHGMFGYEGEGFMRSGEDLDSAEPERGADDYPTGYAGNSNASEVKAADQESGGLGGPERRSMPRRGGAYSWRSQMDPADETFGSRRVSFRGKGPKGYRRPDERIHEDICERLKDDHDVDASGIEVTVSEGFVRLAGFVHARSEKRKAEDLAESVQGVREVENHLRLLRDDRKDVESGDESRPRQY